MGGVSYNGSYAWLGNTIDVNMHRTSVDIINTATDAVFPFTPMALKHNAGVDGMAAMIRDNTIYVFMRDFYYIHNIYNISQSPTSSSPPDPTMEPTNYLTSVPTM